MVIMAKVIMKDGTRNFVTMKPLVRPVATPTAAALITATGMECVARYVPIAIHPANAATDPGAKSTMPAIISIVSPNAMMVMMLT